MKSRYSRVRDPDRLLPGDILVLPKDADCMRLTPSTYSRLGLHNGGTSRSENRTKMVNRVFTELADRTQYLEVSGCIPHPEIPGPEAARRISLLSNVAHDSPTYPVTESCTIEPLNVRMVSGYLNPISSLWYYNLGSAINRVRDIVVGERIETRFIKYADDQDLVKAIKLAENCGSDEKKPVPEIETYKWMTARYEDELKAGIVGPNIVDKAFIEDVFGRAKYNSVKFGTSGRFVREMCARGAYVVRTAGPGIQDALAEAAAHRMFLEFAEGFKGRISCLAAVRAELPKAKALMEGAARRYGGLAVKYARSFDSVAKSLVECTTEE